MNALASARVETAIAAACLVAAISLLAMHGRGLTTMIAIGLAMQAVNYGSAPVVALIASAELPNSEA
jgi:hypothetical protein